MQFVNGGYLKAAGNVSTTENYLLDLLGPNGGDTVSVQAVYSNGTTGAKTFASGVVEVDTITFAAKASTANGDYFVVNDYLGGAWAVALDTLGTGAATPTGAAWVAIPAANKVYLDISSATDGADVAALVETGINLLVGFTTVITAADSTDTLVCTAPFAGVVTAPTNYTKNGAAGTGSIGAVATTPGTASALNPVTNVVTVASHGQSTGSKVQVSTSSALPTGLSTSTDYFIIALSSSTLQFADSLAHAVAGTAITLTSSGVGTQTITPVTSTTNVLKAQCSNDGVNFADITTTANPTCPVATVTIATSSGSVVWDFQRPSFRYLNIKYTPTSGQINLALLVCAKKDT